MSEPLFLSLGSNLGDRKNHIISARNTLSESSGIADVRMAELYETQPLYNPDQPRFLNTVVQAVTNLDPDAVLDITQAIEQQAGRPVRRKKNQPRILDIDILSIGRRVIKNTELSLPHPDLINRKFVLVPWNEIAPEYIVPYWNRSVRELVRDCPDQSIVEVYKGTPGL